jgi:hypothetical protein
MRSEKRSQNGALNIVLTVMRMRMKENISKWVTKLSSAVREREGKSQSNGMALEFLCVFTTIGLFEYFSITRNSFFLSFFGERERMREIFSVRIPLPFK